MCSLSGFRVLMVSVPCSTKVVISTLAVAMPRNDLARREREDARLNVGALRDYFNIFDRIIGFSGCFRMRRSVPRYDACRDPQENPNLANRIALRKRSSANDLMSAFGGKADMR